MPEHDPVNLADCYAGSCGHYAAQLLPDTGSLGASEYDPLYDLERAVIEAAVDWRANMNFADESHETAKSSASQGVFNLSVDALIAAREKQ